MMKQNTEEWYETRRKYIGASEASIVMGLNPWRTSKSLWEEKTGIKEPSRFENKYMREGTLKEPKALKRYNELTRLACEDKVFVSDDFSFMRASMDGYDTRKRCGVEIKCPQKKTFEKLSKEIPPYYYAQLQHQMVCSNLKKIDFFVYLDDETYSSTHVDLDEDFAKKMIEKERIFWDHVQNVTVPPDKKDKKFVERDLDFSELCEVFDELRAYKKDIEKDMKTVWDKILKIGDGENSHHQGYYLERTIRKGGVDYSTIPELKDVDIEKYRKTECEIWRLNSKT